MNLGPIMTELERVIIAHLLTTTMGIEKGFLFEGDGGMYNGSGAYEQTLIVMPERRLVFAAHAFTGDVGYIGMINNALNT